MVRCELWLDRAGVLHGAVCGGVQRAAVRAAGGDPRRLGAMARGVEVERVVEHLRPSALDGLSRGDRVVGYLPADLVSVLAGVGHA